MVLTDLILLGIAVFVGAVTVARVAAWSFSPARRRRLAIREHEKAIARRRAARRRS
jgi:hypothetical protein